jgi:Na+/pantothenate symporter
MTLAPIVLMYAAFLVVGIGATFGVILGMDLVTAILLAAVVTTAYTTLGGMWSVAYTDVVQLGLVALGLLVAIPFAFAAGGGFEHGWSQYVAARPDGSGVIPTPIAGGMWSTAAIVSWTDLGLPRLIPYPEVFPFKAVAAAAGLVILFVVSRLTARSDPPRPLRNAADENVDFESRRPTTQYEPHV